MKAQRLYKKVADELMAIIDSGQYGVGQRLPAERDLAAKFNVSRPTMREAMIALEIAGRVEVRKGSGVYVLDHTSNDVKSLDMNVGPFELTEARMLIEGEAAGLAATLITDEEIAELGTILDMMKTENDESVSGEVADKAFHMLIAHATRNSALEGIIEELWSLREGSQLTLKMYDTVRLVGVKPSIHEHVAIFDALKARDPITARRAMRLHLSRVIDTMFEATEIEAVEKAKLKVSQERKRFAQVFKPG